jgi:uncharacterized protein (DUF2235 family)
MSKNIVILSDGTGQKGGIGAPTNVYRLFNMLEARTDRQIVYYDPGIGTEVNKIWSAITGRGFAKNILECYRFIFEHYQAGDKVFLFGFSRGAATVRSLSGFIHLFGVLPQSRPDLIEEAFSIYKITDEKRRKQKADEFIAKHHTMWLKIRFLGVWDTVAALGFPNPFVSALADRFVPHKFHSFSLSDSVEFARHAISIDDKRKTFHPVLWDSLKDDDGTRLKQVWFAGVHTDVGGGYQEGDLAGFSFQWMLREAREKGIHIYEKSKEWEKFSKQNFDIEGQMHNEQARFPGSIFKSEVRKWNVATHGPIHIHSSVLKRKRSEDNSDHPVYNPWVLKIEDRKTVD